MDKNYYTYLYNIKLHRLGAPANFNKGILESRYMILIKETLREVTKKEFDIKFVVPSQENTATKKVG